ncbi:NAD(P)/FAD-dependent oxidoreductase [Pseudomonadota bacterium]
MEEFRKKSFWLDTVPGSLDPRAALQENLVADVAIIGAGYTGLWTAYYLKQINPALNIVILEAEIAGFGASGRNGGWCAGFLSGIDRWLDDPLHRDGALRLQRLMFDTVAEVGRVTERESIDCHFEQSGALEIAVLPAQLKRLNEELAYMQGLGFDSSDYRFLSAGEIQETLNVDQAMGAILMSHCAAIHPARLARGLADTVENLGVSLYEQSPVLELQGNQIKTPQGTVKAGITILATEGYGGTLPGHERRLIPVHSMMVATEPLSQEQIEAISMHRRYTFGNLDHVTTYGQLTADGRIAFGCRGTYHYGSRVQAQFDQDDPDFELVRQTLIRLFPVLQGIRFTHAWGGAMGVSRSLQPSMHFQAGAQLAWAGGFFGNGVGATHLAGQTLADLVTGRDTDRVHTPWVNPPQAGRKWEPEPLRWLGIKTARKLRHMADRAEYRNSRFTPLITGALDRLTS